MSDEMTLKEKWQRLNKPTCLADYELSVNLSDLAKSEPELYRREVVPIMRNRVASQSDCSCYALQTK